MERHAMHRSGARLVFLATVLVSLAWHAQAAGHDDDKIKCNATAAALSALQSLPQGMTSGVASWGYYFQVSDVSSVPLFLSGGVTALNRGTVFIPHKEVDPRAYAPYAIGSAGRARYTVIAAGTDEALVNAAIAANPQILTWTLVAHGTKAGKVAATVAASQPNVTALALLGSSIPYEVDFSGSNLGVFLYYGSNDTVVPRSSIASFASRLPVDAYVAPDVVNGSHYDFTYSTCSGNEASANGLTQTQQELQSNKSAAVGSSVQTSLYGILRFQPWAVATARALSYGSTSLLASKPYPTPTNVVTFTQRLAAGHTSQDPPKSWYIFKPTTIKAGMVYFQGGGVAAESYFALAFEMAARGHLVCLLDVPSRITFNDLSPAILAGEANAVISVIGNDPTYAGAEYWSVAGHSRGAAAAGVYGAATQTLAPNVYALVLHGGNPAGNVLLSSPLPVIAVYGSLDAAPNPSNFNPSTTEFYEVSGANHRQVGDYEYPVSINDPSATISLQEQQSIFAQKTVEFLDLRIPA